MQVERSILVDSLISNMCYNEHRLEVMNAMKREAFFL